MRINPKSSNSPKLLEFNIGVVGIRQCKGYELPNM